MLKRYLSEPHRFVQSIARNLRDESFRQLIGRIAIGTVAISWLLWLSSPFLLLGQLAYVRANEFGDSIYPQLVYIVHMLQADQLSLWLPSQAGGTDLFGNFNSPLLNLLLFYMLPAWLAYSLIFLIVTAISCISTYVLLRRSFHCATWAACLGAGAYCTWFLYGGMVFAYMFGLCLALSPLVLHFLLSARGWPARYFIYGATLGFAFACGGQFAWSIFDLGTVSFCTLLLAPRRISYWLPYLAVMCLIVVVIQLPFILANNETLPFSARLYYGPYYYINGFESMLGSYILTNPTPYPYFQVIGGASAMAVLAVAIASSRWAMIQRVWPVWGLSALFVLLPVIDIAVIYILSLLRLSGYQIQSDGGFGGPMDIRLRHSRIFVACIAIALAADLFWKAGRVKDLVGSIVSLESNKPRRRIKNFIKPIISLEGNRRCRQIIVRFAPLRSWFAPFRSWSRLVSKEIGSVKWRRGRFIVRFGTFRFLSPLSRLAMVAVVAFVGAKYALGWASAVRADINDKHGLALDGMNFTSFYAQTDLRKLAAANPAFDTYRVATIQLYGPDSDYSAWPQRDPSLFAPFQNTYGFETADGYMSNITTRSMNFWNWLILSAPDYGHDGRHPRAVFNDAYMMKFAHFDQSFSQKLYLFEPLNSKNLDKDGCIRTQTPIDFSANYNLDMLSLDNVAFIVSAIPLSDPRLTLLESATRENLRALQCAPHAVRLKAFRERGLMGRPLYIYRNRGFVPRVFAPKSVDPLADETAMLQTLIHRSTQELAATALVVRSEVPASVAAAPENLQVVITKVETVRDDHMKITVQSRAGGLVVVSDSFSPFWHASTDGGAVPVFPAYHTFIGMWVPGGDHVIDLRYRPPYARWLGYREDGT